MAHRDFMDLPRRTASDKVSHYKGFNIAKIPEYEGCQLVVALMVYKFFEKKSSGANTSGGAVTRENKSAINSELCQNNY